MSIDFRVVNSALDPEVVVPQWLPGGKRVHNEWVAANPTRGDKTAGSFSVNLKTGVWSDFAGDSRMDRGGDLVGLYAYLFHNRSQVEAARELMRNHGIVDDTQARERVAKAPNVSHIDDQKPTPIIPVPEGTPKLASFRHWKHGDASKAWEYLDRQGRLMFYVARYDVEPRKQIVPWSWCFDPKKNIHRWANYGISGTKARPLYGLEKLSAYPGHDVIVVEGEKAADAAQEIMGDTCVVLSWLGGVPTADKVSVKPLENRRVYLWPDFDAQREKLTIEEANAGIDPDSKPLLRKHEQPGVVAMMAIAEKLRGITADANILMVNYEPMEQPHGWDLADGLAEGMTGEQVLTMLRERARDPRAVARGEPIQPEAKPATEPKKADKPARIATPLELAVNQFDFPDKGDKLAPLDTLENMEYMLGEYGIDVRYNVIAKEVEITIPERTFSQDNHMEGCLTTIGSLSARNGMPRGNIPGYITTLADANQYNPAAEWIDSKEWDGKDRIEALAASLDAQDPEMAVLLLRKWMIGAVASVYEREGFSMQGVIVLQGAQGLGKTTWIMGMADHNRKLVKESAILNPADKDSRKEVVSYWLVELGELEATFSKSDITALRGFITLKMDEMRLPYAKATSKFPRRTALLASVNEHAYLRDENGNRRYWTIRCGDGLNAFHGIDVQQAWAQVKSLYLAGSKHNLTKEENDRLSESNLDHTERNPIEDLIMSHYSWEQPALNLMTAAEVCVDIGYTKPTQKDAKGAAMVLRKATGGEPKKTNGRLVFAVPPKRYRKSDGNTDSDGRPF